MSSILNNSLQVYWWLKHPFGRVKQIPLQDWEQKMIPEDFPAYLVTSENRKAGAYLETLAEGSLDALVVLGSGLAQVLDSSARWGTPRVSIQLSSIPGVLAPTADGHLNELRIYDFQVDEVELPLRVAVALGRTHLYEGFGPLPVTSLVRGAYCAGARLAILCNANGCLRDWNLGEVMAIEDHLNFTGVSPFDGTVFLDTSNCWDQQLTEVLATVCQRQGTYAILRGPEYQTRAETRLLDASGVDCVGMSTVMEALTLHALGIRVCGMSVVSDLSLSTEVTDPSAVVDIAARAQSTMLAGIEAALEVEGLGS